MASSPREIGDTGESHLGPLSTLRSVVVVPAGSATGWGLGSLFKAPWILTFRRSNGDLQDHWVSCSGRKRLGWEVTRPHRCRGS